MARTSRKPRAFVKRAAYASRDTGRREGAAFAGWNPRKVTSEAAAAHERRRTQDVAADLAANSWLAESLLSVMQYNVVGDGLTPRAQIPAKELNLTDEQAIELNRRFEWAFARWAACADVRGRSTFGEMQFTALRTMLALGEAVHLPVMLSEAERKARALPYSLSIQSVSPTRLRTPAGMEHEPDVQDGIRFDEHGRPVAYYLACPKADGVNDLVRSSDDSVEFATVPAWAGHRPNLLHLFVRKEEEQIRGESVFCNSAVLCRYIDDAIRYELEGQNFSAKYSIFVEKSDRFAVIDGVEVEKNTETGDEVYYSSVDGAAVMYGNPGEKPQMIASNRPSNNWAGLVKLGMGGFGGSAGLSYLAVSRNYEKVNYSSARAAMNADWKVFMWFRNFLARHYCQCFWEMVIEEAYLRGEWEVPVGAPDFYEARELWTSAMWTGPARGFMDPVKEIEATVMAVDNHLMTRHEALAEYGRDFDDEYVTLLAEHEKMRALKDEDSLSTRGGAGNAAPNDSAGPADTPPDGDDE